MTDRFTIEHGVVHDIKTGRHLTQAIEDDYPQQLCDLLNEQERTIDGYREALLVLVELKRFKRQIEAGTANADMKRYYEANKEGAWLGAEAMLVGCVRTEVERMPEPLMKRLRAIRDEAKRMCQRAYDGHTTAPMDLNDHAFHIEELVKAILSPLERKPAEAVKEQARLYLLGLQMNRWQRRALELLDDWNAPKARTLIEEFAKNQSEVA